MERNQPGGKWVSMQPQENLLRMNPYALKGDQRVPLAAKVLHPCWIVSLKYTVATRVWGRGPDGPDR